MCFCRPVGSIVGATSVQAVGEPDIVLSMLRVAE